MHLLGCDAKNLAGATGNAGKQLRDSVSVQPVQRAPQTVIIEHPSRDCWPQQVFDGFVGKELRHQIQLSIAKA